MRIGVFEVDVATRESVSIAEVFSGKAPLLRFLSVKNVRGSERDWMKITAVIKGAKEAKIKNDILIRDRTVGNCDIDSNDKDQPDLLLPKTLQPGDYEGELRIVYSVNKRITGESNGEKIIPFRLKVPDSSCVPTDLAHAPYLASWIPLNDDELRGFAANACRELKNSSPQYYIKALYESLIHQNLVYHRVCAPQLEDFQQVSSYKYILQKGGSCMELSLLMASLLMILNMSPVLLLYGNHITSGCFSTEKLPDVETIENPKLIEEMILQRQLILPEMTDVCSGERKSFGDSLDHALAFLRENGVYGCRLINLKKILRNGTVQPLPDYILQSSPDIQLLCPVCGYNDIRIWKTDDEIICPACGNQFRPNIKKEVVSAAVPDIIYDPRQVRYECRGQIAGVARCLTNTSDVIHILPYWQDKPVTYIGDHAFENNGISSVVLPESISEIKDRAFRGCEKITSIKLPSNLSHLGPGAFSSSGLESLIIPGSVEKIPTLCFSGCEHLKTVTLEDGVREIDSQAFIHCPMLKNVYLPATVKRVSKTAFDPSCRLVYTSSQTRLD